jgi:hypothetical protein
VLRGVGQRPVPAVLAPAGPLFTATLASALGCAAIGAVVGDLDLTPSWSGMGWLILLALSSQVAGWLLISASLARGLHPRGPGHRDGRSPTRLGR